jgi:hypothetical protein
MRPNFYFSIFGMVLHLSKFGKFFKSTPCLGIQIFWFESNPSIQISFLSQVDFWVLKGLQNLIYWIFILWKYSNLPLNSNPELNSNFLDPKSFVWTQIIIGLEFKILWFESLNQSLNSYFWRSLNFSLEFKIQSNLFESIQIAAQNIQKELKSFF